MENTPKPSTPTDPKTMEFWKNKPGMPNPLEYDWLAPIEKQLKGITPTTLNFSTGPDGVAVSDNRGNEFIQRPNGTPAITCDGKAQGINIEKGINAAAAVIEQLPPQALTGALESAAKAGSLPSTSDSVTFEGESPLTQLCNAGKAAGILQR